MTNKLVGVCGAGPQRPAQQDNGVRTKDESIVFTHQIMDKLVVNNYVITTEQYKC